MATLSTIRTPALILDLSVLKRNLEAMSRRAQDRGVDLRPHCKTAKSVEIARLATEKHSGGVTVSTLREAEYFVHNGFNDVTYAVGIVPSKLAPVLELQRKGATVSLLTDNLEIARALAAEASRLEAGFRIFVEVDCGDHRAGVAPESESLIEIGKAIHEAPDLELAGVLTHGGQSYGKRGAEEIRTVAVEERDSVVRAAERLRKAGLPCPTVSLGSTPSAVHGTTLEGVDEIRPGTYVFFDLMMVALGVCNYGEIAVSVLASVIGHNVKRNHALIDAGALALSKDVGIRHDGHPYGAYGLLRGSDGPKPRAGLAIDDVSQEHGRIVTTGKGRFPFGSLPVGERVRVLPNHACLTAAAHDRYLVIDGGDEIVAEWPRLTGW
jgi:D-serine deaminase-like pyridoxal phosphate-dependent protein